MDDQFSSPEHVMQRALELARRGLGAVEPNPPVGAVIVDGRLRRIAEGYHERYGGPHAEIRALEQAGSRAAGGTMYVTLEPCCHHGQTPPCTDALLRAGLSRMIVAIRDPSPHAAGQGIEQLRTGGVTVESGLLEGQASRLAAPFLKLVTVGRPYVHAKWAMTLDGKIASRTGSSRWISNSASRRIGHALRGRMDAVVVGRQTAFADDPLLTARPPGPRVATRIVVDSGATLSTESQLVCTLDQAPVLVAAVESAPADNVRRLESAGVEVLRLPPEPRAVLHETTHPDFSALLDALGERRMTNVLVEGGGRLLGSLFDRKQIDAVHVFLAPKLVGGSGAVTPIAGTGLDDVPELPQLDDPVIEVVEGDVYMHGPLRHDSVGERPV